MEPTSAPAAASQAVKLSFNNEFRRFTVTPSSLEALRAAVAPYVGKDAFVIRYTDDDGDLISCTTEGSLRFYPLSSVVSESRLASFSSVILLLVNYCCIAACFRVCIVFAAVVFLSTISVSAFCCLTVISASHS